MAASSRLQWIALSLGIFLVACGGGGTEHSGPGGRNPPLGQAYPYRADSPVAEVLVGCVDLDRSPASCSIGALPPLGLEDESPDADAILDRLVVSHDWMGRRFATLLESFPQTLRDVLRPVTAIVIADEVRPSFYSAATGAIYVDPRHLWIFEDEEETISDEADFRANYGRGFSFAAFATYLDGRQPAFSSGEAANRTLTSRIYAVAALLFHEGAHANDFLPVQAFPSLRSDETFFEATERLADRRLAERLAADSPLGSRLWKDLALVLYFGEEPSEAQLGLTAEEVGFAFAGDGASDPYAYSSIREDFAMLFEQTMMKLHFDLDRQVGFVSRPAEGAGSCRDYVVAWGMSSRISGEPVRWRAQLVAESILGDRLEGFFDALPAPSFLVAGEDLCRDSQAAPASVLDWM